MKTLPIALPKNLKFADISKRYSKLLERVEAIAESKAKIKVKGEDEIDDDIYYGIYDPLVELLEKQLGSVQTLCREDTYEIDEVLKFAKAPLNGYTVLLVDQADESNWVISWYRPKAIETLDKWAAMSDEKLLAQIKK